MFQLMGTGSRGCHGASVMPLAAVVLSTAAASVSPVSTAGPTARDRAGKSAFVTISRVLVSRACTTVTPHAQPSAAVS